MNLSFCKLLTRIFLTEGESKVPALVVGLKIVFISISVT